MKKFQKQKILFDRLRSPLVTIAKSKVDVCFWKTHSTVFMQKLTWTRCFLFFFAISMKPKCNLLWKLGLDIPLDDVLVRVFVLHSFSCSNDLKVGYTISMAPRMVSFDLVWCSISKNNTFFSFLQAEHGFSFLNRGSQLKLWTFEPP